MKKNIGLIDRVLRIVIGIVLIALSLFGKIGIWGWIGIVPLATAAISLCPLYSLIGLNTGAAASSTEETTTEEKAND